MAIPVNAKAGQTANWSRKKLPYGWVMVKENYFQGIHLIMKQFDCSSNTLDALTVLRKRFS